MYSVSHDKMYFPKTSAKISNAMMRCLQKIRGKVNTFEKAKKISQLLFELTNKQIIAAFLEYMDFYSYRKLFESRKL